MKIAIAPRIGLASIGRMWTYILILTHYILAAAIVVRVLLRPRMEPVVRLVWIMVIEALPFVGVALYLLFGEVRQRRANVQKARDVRSLLTDLWRPAPQRITTPPQEAQQVVAAMQAIGGMNAVGGNHARLLPEDDSAIEAMAAAITEAKEHVHLLFYIWLADHSGGKVAEAAIAAAQRGVKVRIIVDALGSRAFVRSPYWARLKEAGAECVTAFPFGRFLLYSALFQRLDLRNHRKVAVIDNRVAFGGSRNCADMAFRVKAKYAPWVDILMRIEGPVVRQMQAVFLQDWMSYTGEDLGQMLEMVPAVADPGQIAQVVATGPDLRQGSISDCLTTLIYAARERLTITTPYYVPDAALDIAIRSAARRGVEVTMIVPKRNDSLVVGATSEGFYEELIRAGVRLMLFKPGLLHAKIMTVDGKMAMVGSANLDRRSFDLNYENNILLLSESLTADLDARQETYIARADHLTLDQIRGWSRLRRLRNNLLALATPLL